MSPQSPPAPAPAVSGLASKSAVILQPLLRFRRASDGQDLEKVAHDTDRDYFMTAQEAKDYGIIDVVVTHRDGRPA